MSIVAITLVATALAYKIPLGSPARTPVVYFFFILFTVGVLFLPPFRAYANGFEKVFYSPGGGPVSPSEKEA